MSLKSEFNKQVSRKTKINELSLIDALIDAVNSNTDSYAAKYHGSKGFVKFDINVSLPLVSYSNVKCEVADILCIFIGRSEIRYTFLQNKYSKPTGSDICIQHVNTRQHYLLSERPTINSLSTGLPPNILSDALCPGAGSYGDFFKENDEYDMRYFVAKSLLYIKNKRPDFYDKKKSYKFHNTYLDMDWLNSYNDVLECSHTCNLDNFETMVKNMLIGSPIDIDNEKLCGMFFKAIKYVLSQNNDTNDLLFYARELLRIHNEDDDKKVFFPVKGIALFDCRKTNGNIVIFK